jgi:hypothetical protein
VNQEQVALVDLATYLPVIENKIVIEGYGNGGMVLVFFAETQPQINILCTIPSASYYNTTKQ